MIQLQKIDNPYIYLSDELEKYNFNEYCSMIIKYLVKSKKENSKN